MTAIAGGIGIKAAGVAGAALLSADLARARVFYIVRLGFPLVFDETDRFAFGAGGISITVRCPGKDSASNDPPRLLCGGIEAIALWCTRDELHRVADALTAAGIEHSGVNVHPRLGVEVVAFEDPDGLKWELQVR